MAVTRFTLFKTEPNLEGVDSFNRLSQNTQHHWHSQPHGEADNNAKLNDSIYDTNGGYNMKSK